MKFSELKPGDYFKFVYINGAMSFVFRKLLGDRCYSVIDFSCGCWGPDTKVVKCDESGKEIVEAVSFDEIKCGEYFRINCSEINIVYQKPYSFTQYGDIIAIKSEYEETPYITHIGDTISKKWIIVASPDI